MKYLSKYRVLLVALASFVIVFTTIVFFLSKVTYPDRLLINGNIFNIEVADNQVLREKGLSGHSPLNKGEGMLFVFNYPGDYGIWMKDMTFPIDIVWINENNRVVHIEKSVSPNTYPKVFYSTLNALYVLEIASGESDRVNLKNGDLIEFLKKSPRKLGV